MVDKRFAFHPLGLSAELWMWDMQYARSRLWSSSNVRHALADIARQDHEDSTHCPGHRYDSIRHIKSPQTRNIG